MNKEPSRVFEERETPTIASTPSARRKAAVSNDVAAPSSRFVRAELAEKQRRLPRAS